MKPLGLVGLSLVTLDESGPEIAEVSSPSFPAPCHPSFNLLPFHHPPGNPQTHHIRSDPTPGPPHPNESQNAVPDPPPLHAGQGQDGHDRGPGPPRPTRARLRRDARLPPLAAGSRARARRPRRRDVRDRPHARVGRLSARADPSRHGTSRRAIWRCRGIPGFHWFWSRG